MSLVIFSYAKPKEIPKITIYLSFCCETGTWRLEIAKALIKNLWNCINNILHTLQIGQLERLQQMPKYLSVCVTK